MYAKDPYEDKYQFLINKRESIGLKHFNDHKAFTEYSGFQIKKNVFYFTSKFKNILIYEKNCITWKESALLTFFKDVVTVF